MRNGLVCFIWSFGRCVPGSIPVLSPYFSSGFVKRITKNSDINPNRHQSNKILTMTGLNIYVSTNYLLWSRYWIRTNYIKNITQYIVNIKHMKLYCLFLRLGPITSLIKNYKHTKWRPYKRVCYSNFFPKKKDLYVWDIKRIRCYYYGG